MGRHFGGHRGGGHHHGPHHGPHHHHHHGPHHHGHHWGWGWRPRRPRGCCGCWTLIMAALGIGAVVLLSLLFWF